MTSIAGHKLTDAQVEALDALQGYMRKNAGDSHWSSGTSPKGDGREVSIYEVFPHGSNLNTARRRSISRLAHAGVLRCCEMEMDNFGMLKGVPLKQLFAKENYANTGNN